MSDLTDISRFRWLTVWLADNLVPEDIHKVQTLLKEYLKGGHTGDDALAIFDFLAKQNRIHDEDTGLLRTLFTSLGRMDLLEAVNDYEREKITVAKRLGRNSSNLGGPYFGRHDMLNKLITVLDTLSYDHIHGICISGDAGVGKTRLALEACARMKGSHNLVTVDLHGLPSIESVYYAIMHAFGVTCREFELDNLFGFLRAYYNSRYASTVLLLDNANSVLDPGSIGTTNPTYEQFVDTIKTILGIANPRLKIIMTSRFDLDIGAGFSSKTMSAFRLNQYNGLDTDAAVRMFRYHAGNTPISYEDAKAVTNLCGNNPMIIKVLANRLQDGKAKLTNILPTHSSNPEKADLSTSLSGLNLCQKDRLQGCLKSSFQSLPKKHRVNMVKLSTIPGGFSLDAARKVLKYRKKDLGVLQYDLQHLKYLGLLEKKKLEPNNQFSDKVAPYRVPANLRDFVVNHVKSEEGDDLKTFQKAQNRFIQFYGKKLRNICKLLQTDVCNGLSRLHQDAVGYLGFLDILKIADDFKPSKNLWWVILAIERLLSPTEAQKLYNFMAQQAKQRDDIHAFADLRCYEIMLLKELGHDPEKLLQQLIEVQDILNQKVDSAVDVSTKQFSLATCYCLRGELLTQTNKTPEAIQWLQQAVSLRKQVLGGNHFLIARALKSLGVAFKKGASPGSKVDINAEKTKAKAYFMQAYEMCRHLANGSDKHLDIPGYIADIGDILRELGQHEDAIECMSRGVELESALGMGGAVAACGMQEKIASSYCEMERFGDAIPVAKQLMERRKKLSGQTSPETAHAIYILGSIYLKARNYQEAKAYLTEALEIEEALWGRGLPHSDDWQNLKMSIETMMVTLQKQSTLTSYRKRFQDADDLSLKGKLLQNARGDAEDSDDESDRSSLPSENEDELPGSISSENEDELPGSISSENDDELPGSDDSSEDEGPATRKLAEQDPDDETSSNSSSVPSEIADELPAVRVDRNLNHLGKDRHKVEPAYQPGSKESSPSGSSGVGSSDEMTRDLTH